MKRRSKLRQLAAGVVAKPEGLLTQVWRPWLENARAKKDFEKHFEDVDRQLAELILGPKLARLLG
jgi:hypothetical protein